MEIIAGTV